MQRMFFLIAILLLISCEENEPQFKILRGEAFGTTYSIQYYSSASFSAERGIDSVIHAVNKSVSTYMPNSDISKINRGDSTLVVDAIFKDVFNISETVFTNSLGYFDPTIGVLRNAYGFGDVRPLHTIDKKAVDSLMQFVGFRKVFISKENRVVKEKPEIYFDFNAVAKGYGIDCIGRYLELQGVSNYLIELGGELLAKGTNRNKNKLWVVGIESVGSNMEDRAFSKAISLTDKGMASSGNYRKFRTDSISGKKYVHTINPLTGSAEQSDVTSATVVAASCGLADAYATAFMALGLEKSRELLSVTEGVEAYLTHNDSLNVQQVFMTDGFANLLVN